MNSNGVSNDFHNFHFSNNKQFLNDLKIDKNSEFIFQTNELKLSQYLQIFLL
jgi:hypothetical protein